jgi:hypothetical protein
MPPPFFIIAHIYGIIKQIWNLFSSHCCKRLNITNDQNVNDDPFFETLENACRLKYNHHHHNNYNHHLFDGKKIVADNTSFDLP